MLEYCRLPLVRLQCCTTPSPCLPMPCTVPHACSHDQPMGGHCSLAPSATHTFQQTGYLFLAALF